METPTMSMTEILKNKDATSAEKLAEIAKVVSVARKAYGNEEVTITPPEVSTAYGTISFIHLEDDSKISILEGEIRDIKMFAVEKSKAYEGVVINKVIEEMVATNPYLVNCAEKSDFSYL